MKKISLIIPVYNVEKFLGRCLESVQEQTYKEAQVIIVNDGSTDNSPAIIDDYVSRNENFSAYKIENSGLGGARNYGLTVAEGEYIVFLDSDDYIASDCLEKLLKAAEQNNSDIVVCNSCDVAEDGTPLSLSEANIKNKTTSLEESPHILLNRPSAWGKMYRKAFFDDLSYVEREWYEDLRLTPKLYLKAKKITYIDDALFFYVQRAGSIMNSAKAIRNLEIIDAFEDLIAYFKEKGVYAKFKEELNFLLVDHIAVAAITRVILSDSKDKNGVLEKLEQYISQFKELYQNKYLPLLGFNKKLILFFNRKKLYFLTALCMKIKRKLK